MPEAVKVVDSWAMVAWVQDEPAASAVETYLQDPEDFLSRLPSLPIRIVLPDEVGIMDAARIKAAHPVAFGDAFAIALAQAERASVVTGHEEIRRCGAVPVDWVAGS